MRIIVVGGVASGASFAARYRRLNENDEIVIYEKSNYISYANCGLPYYIGDVITNKNNLTLQSPELFLKRFNILVKINHEVTNIDKKKKEIEVLDLKNDLKFTDKYDKLILATGAKAIKPNLPGSDLENIFTLRNIEDTYKIKEFVSHNNIDNIAIIGGGFIGVEMAENLAHIGKKTHLIELGNHILVNYDEDMVPLLEREMVSNGVDLLLNKETVAFEKEDEEIKIHFKDGESLKVKAIILAIGVIPDNDLLKKADLKLGIKGSAAVDECFQTSDENIYAIGDLIQVNNLISHTAGLISLAGPANKEGRLLADILNGVHTKFHGAFATSIIKIFNLVGATTGLNEKIIKTLNREYEKIIIAPLSHASYYPGATALTIKLLFDKNTYEIYGAQIIGKEGVDKHINVLATAIKTKMKAYELKDLDLAYAPPFSSAKDPINFLGYIADNIFKGLVKQFHLEDIPTILANKNNILLDVRTDYEYSLGHIAGALHLELDKLRQTHSQLNKNKKIYIHCQSGLRSYLACRYLNNLGYEAYNLAGGYYFYSLNQKDNKKEPLTNKCR